MLDDKGLDIGEVRFTDIQNFLRRLKDLMPVFGITRISNLTGLDRIGIPVVAAHRPNSRALATSQGKGWSLEEAKIAALMESIESYHAENIYKPTLNISVEDLQERAQLVDIYGLARKGEKSLKLSEKIMWLEGIDILNDREVFVPYDCVTTDLTSVNLNTPFVIDSNGLAAGACEEDAVIHGIHEVIERDALALYAVFPELYEQRKIILDTITGDLNIKALNLLNRAGILVGLWDITSDIGIPTFVCKLSDPNDDHHLNVRPAYGSASHSIKEVALFKAVIEAAQSRLTFISGSRDDQLPSVYESFDTDCQLKSWRKEIDSESKVSFGNVKSMQNSNLSILDHLKQSLSDVGIKQIVTVNLSKEEFGLSIYKILVPHLEGIAHLDKRVKGHRLSENCCYA